MTQHRLATAVLVVLAALAVCAPGSVSARRAGLDAGRSDPGASSLGIRLVRIPDGEFLMGSAEGEAGHVANEGPVHRVRITRDFEMGVHEVTNGQFRAFVDATGYRTEGWFNDARQNRSAQRIYFNPTFRYCLLSGFRVVRELERSSGRE